MGSTRETGRRGEELAAEYLKSVGLKIVEANYTCRRGEIDLVARDGRILVFVEVKTARGGNFGRPISWVDPPKQKRLATLAASYIQERGLEGVDVRFDVVGVEWEGDSPRIVHLPDAFRP